MTTTELVEVGTCQVCQGTQHTQLFEEPPFSVQRCTDCGLVFVSPRMTEEDLHAEVYSESYWRSDRPREQGYADYAQDEELYLKTFRRRFGLVNEHCPQPGRVLDVGCAAGFFLRTAKERGWDTYGVEPSAAIATNAQQHLGEDRVFVGVLGDAPPDRGFEPGSFDLVTMWDVVEHVPDPQQLLRQARQMLKPNGTLILETQNVSSRFANLLGRKWHHYKHREHLYHFNPDTVQRLLQQGGFDVLKNTASYGGKYVSFGFIAERAARLNGVLSFLLRPLALFRNANVYLNFRDEMVVVARPSA
ncbi:MAG: class I SAM-dependent methyltransferase [Planctomycetota bacterium]